MFTADRGYVECGFCGQHFPFTDDLFGALYIAEYQHLDGDEPCEALGKGGEHLIVVGDSPERHIVRYLVTDEEGASNPDCRMVPVPMKGTA